MARHIVSRHLLDIALGIYTYTYPEVDDIEIEVSVPRPNGFTVYEVVNGISLDTVARDYGKTDACYNRYIYLVKKVNVDSYTLCRLLKEKLKCGSCEVLGLKDAEAVAHQLAILYRCRNPIKELSLKVGRGYIEGFLWQCDTDVIHNGNKFVVKLTVKADSIDTIIDRLRTVKKYGGAFLNFFGYQRFGSRRPITHLLGKLLVKREWDLFTEKLCRYVFSTQFSVLSDIRYRFCSRQYRYPNALAFIRSIPKHYLKLFVNAYQSYLFNIVLSKLWMRILDGRDVGEAIELMNSNYRYIPVIGSRVTVVYYDVKEIIEEVVGAEGIELKDFTLKELEIDARGDFRESLAYARDIFADPKVDEIEMSFVLNRGCYASVFIREIARVNPLLFT